MSKPSTAPKRGTPADPSDPSNVLPMRETLPAALRAMNERVCYIEATSEIARIEPDKLKKLKIPTMSCATFANEAFSHYRADDKAVAAAWMKWRDRRTVGELVYSPGDPRFTLDGNLNTYFPPTYPPAPGDISIFHRYMDGLMENAPEYKPWLLAWLAYKVQHPKKKILTAVMCWSFEQGNGKSTLGWIMRHVFGLHNSGKVTTKFPDRFNSYAENVLFIWADELIPVKKSDQQDMIKSMVTQSQVMIEHKGKRPYEIPDLASIYFTSNHPNALDLKQEDRRFFVHNVGRNSLTSEWWETVCWPWLNRPESIAAIHHYLLHDIDLSLSVIGGNPESLTPAPFNPSAWAPRTDARAQMIADNRDDIETWLWELKDNPEKILGEDESHRTIFTSDELYARYQDQVSDTKTTLAIFRHRMTPALVRLNKGQSVRLSKEQGRPYLYSTDPAKAALDVTQIKACLTQERE